MEMHEICRWTDQSAVLFILQYLHYVAARGSNMKIKIPYFRVTFHNFHSWCPVTLPRLCTCVHAIIQKCIFVTCRSFTEAVKVKSTEAHMWLVRPLPLKNKCCRRAGCFLICWHAVHLHLSLLGHLPCHHGGCFFVALFSRNATVLLRVECLLSSCLKHLSSCQLLQLFWFPVISIRALCDLGMTCYGRYFSAYFTNEPKPVALWQGGAAVGKFS